MKKIALLAFFISSNLYADFLVPFVVEDESTRGTGWDFIVKLVIWLGTAVSILMAMKYLKIAGSSLLKNDYIEAVPSFVSGALCMVAAEYFRNMK